MLWKGSRDGFAASMFHSKCDGKGPTLTVIQSTDGAIFGGFTSYSWCGDGSYHEDKTAFIYSITKGYKCDKQNNTISIQCNSDYGPLFGDGHDIAIQNNCDATNENFGTGVRSGGSTYQLPSGESFIAGTKNFTVKEIEVYSVIKQ